MADSAAEARIRDLKRRLELDPGSRLFVALAEEYRKSRRHQDALSTLQKGLLAHPHYLSAQVALGRAYLEAGQITEAIATFSKALSADPGNLVAARSLADIYLSRGESVEAIKKYKLYRALSGDRRVDEIIARLETELAPPPPPPSSASAEVPPPPTFFEQRRTGAIHKSSERAASSAPAAPAPPHADEAVEMTSVPFEPDDSAPRKPWPAAVPGLVSRDAPLLGVSSVPVSATPEPEPAAAPPLSRAIAPVEPPFSPPSVVVAEPAREAAATEPQPPSTGPEPALPPFPQPEDVATRAFRISEILGTAESGGGERAESEPEARPGEGPRGRVLADLYYAQGHFAEALRIYDDLVAANPYDAELKRMRRDAEARLLPAGTTAGAAAPDPALGRRLAKIRVLKRWLSVVQTG